MTVIRISPRTEHLVKLMKLPDQTIPDFIHQLVVDYYAGTSFTPAKEDVK